MTGATLLLLLAAQSGPGYDMDYGPAFSHTVALRKAKKDEDILAFKGITIKVGPDANVCFDTDLLRLAGGWTGGWLELKGTHYTSSKGSIPPTLRGELKFTTPMGPGWAKDGSLKDPRDIAYGPLPATWGHWNGYYLHGRTVILSYRVGDREILETPGFADGVFTRTLHVGPSKRPATLVVCATGPKVAVSDATAKVGEKDGLTVVTVPARDGASTLVVAIGGEAPRAAPPDLPALRKGGPARWSPALETKGRIGTEKPYAVDTVSVPFKNPWNAWIRITGHDFFSDGRAAVCTWNGDVWTVSGIDAALEKISWRRFATGLYEPLGLKIIDDVVYVLGRDQITRLHDLDGDGEADFHENFNNLNLTMFNYHAFAFELQTDSKGNLYYTRCGHRVDPKVPLHGGVLRVPKDGKGIEMFARGLRAPNGLAIGPHDEITCGDNQGNWVPASVIKWVRKDAFIGYVPHAGGGREPKDYFPVLCWVPYKLDNSSGSQVWVTSDRWGPFKGEMLHTSYGTASLFTVAQDRSVDPPQGGTIRMPLQFDSGIMRARFHPKDGQLYVSGLKGWQTKGTRDAALQRVRYTGDPVHTVRSFKATRAGIELTFTGKIDPEFADPDNFAAERWNYLWSAKYGSPDYSVADPKKKGHDTVEITGAKLSADGRTISLSIPDMCPAMQMLIRIRIHAADGTRIVQDFYPTIRKIP